MNAVTTLPKSMTQADLEKIIDAMVEQRVDEALKKREEETTPSLAIIATKGTVDMAYPPFILASTAAALGWDVSVFFTFYGLELMRKDLDLKISPLGNPAMPMKMPFGPQWFQDIGWNMPNALMSNVPGFESMATSMMNQTLKNKGVASIGELRDICIESEVKLYACQMTVDLFGYDQTDFIDEVADWIGATTFLGISKTATNTLFV